MEPSTIERLTASSPEDSPSLPAVSPWLVCAWSAWAVLVVLVYYRQSFGTALWVEQVGYPEVGQSLLRTGLPYWREASWRAVSGAGSAALVIAAMFAAGRLTARWLMPHDASAAESWVLAYANGAGVLAYALLALAVGGLYQPAIVRVAIVGAVLAGVLALWRHPAPAGASDIVPRAGLLRAAGPRSRADLLWMAITLAAVALAAFCALAPETEYDALWYHLELPRRWLAAGRPVDDITEYVSLYPLTWELLFGAALAFDGSVAARLVHWSTLPVTAALAGLLARRALPAASPWLSAAVFVTAPTVFWDATTTYVDLAMTVHAGFGVYALVRGRQTRDRAWLLVAGLQFGLGGATKHLSLAVTAVALGLFALSDLRHGPWRALRGAALAGVVAVLVASPWYLRAWQASGNPVFPEMYGVLGAAPPERWDHLTQAGLEQFKDRFGRPRTLEHLAMLPWDVTMHGTRYGGTFGPLLLAMLPAAVIVAVRCRMARWILAGSAAYLAVWASPLSSYQLRFLVPVWWVLAPVVALSLALLLRRSGDLHRRLTQLASLAVGALLMLNLPPWTLLHEGDRRGWTGWLTHVVREWPVEVVLGSISEDAFLAEHVRTYGAWQWVNAHTPAEGTRVLTFLGGDHFYSERPRLWSEAVVARDATWGALAGQEASARAAMARLGITHVMAPVPLRRTDEHRRLATLQPAFIAAYADPVYEDGWTLVYRLRSAPDVVTMDQR